MARPKLAIGMLRVEFSGRLELENAQWLESQRDDDRVATLTEALEDALFHVRRCPDASTLELPPRERGGKKTKIHALLDVGNAAWIAEKVRTRQFGSDAAVVDYAVAHRRLCKQRVKSPVESRAR
jgi:hypothetical protein